MSVEKWWNEICGRGKWEKPREKPTQSSFRPPQNPHGVTEMRTRDPSVGRRAPNRLRHEAAHMGVISVPMYLKNGWAGNLKTCKRAGSEGVNFSNQFNSITCNNIFMSWFFTILRMISSRYPKAIIKYHPNGKQSLGRLTRRP